MITDKTLRGSQSHQGLMRIKKCTSTLYNYTESNYSQYWEKHISLEGSLSGYESTTTYESAASPPSSLLVSTDTTGLIKNIRGDSLKYVNTEAHYDN